MLCQKCGLLEATVHREFTMFRQKHEEHLCTMCANESIPYWSPPEPRMSEMERADEPGSEIRVPEDPLRPLEIELPDLIVVEDLASTLRIQVFKAVAILMYASGVFVLPKQEISFELAAKLCERCGVVSKRRSA